MFKIITKSIEWGGRTLLLETGKIARQASGAVVAKYGGTSVLSTVVNKISKENFDFLPLTVQFLSKSYAIGKIPGGFLKREGKPSDRETLISRLIDRSIRPLFPEGYNNEISVICNLLTYDSSSPAEVTALIAVAAALSISGVPFNGPVAGAKVGYLKDEDKYILNPSAGELLNSSLDLFLSGNEQSVLMVESDANRLSEQQVLESMKFAHEHCQAPIQLIKDFSGDCDVQPIEFVPHNLDKIITDVDNLYNERFTKAYSDNVKKTRSSQLEALREEAFDHLKQCYLSEEDSLYSEQSITCAIKNFERRLVRSNIVETGIRIDGRTSTDIRQIEAEVNILPQTHGSALFTRGNTQALVVVAIGTAQDEQIVDDLDGDRREHFILHYNFPPYAVGEATAIKPPGRREIGHGKLAWRAIRPLLPAKEDFPYTIRVVSEITESDGSSSMATVCGTSLALMDTGIPLQSTVAGIAMGLILEGSKFIILSDILGDEDYLGDMDFKVAGTKDGITALQMDMKVCGINFEIITQALEQARLGRLYIINKMDYVISEPRDGVKCNAPKIDSIMIDKDKIRNVIGTGGKNIRHICEKTGAKVEIGQDGNILIYATNNQAAEEAKSMIINLTTEPEIGKVFEGIIEEITTFGAFINILGGKKGLLHISEIKNERINSVEDILSVGDTVKVIVIGIDRDKIQLSMRRVDQDTGEIIEGELYTPRNNESDDEPNGNTSGSNNGSSSKGGGGGGKRRSPVRRGRFSSGGGSRFNSSHRDDPKGSRFF